MVKLWEEDTFKFLDTHIASDLTWNFNSAEIRRKAQPESAHTSMSQKVRTTQTFFSQFLSNSD